VAGEGRFPRHPVSLRAGPDDAPDTIVSGPIPERGHLSFPDDIPDGDVVIASGESLTGQWRIVADAQRQANVGSLTIERMLGTIGSTASTTGDRAGPPLDLGADISDGTVVLGPAPGRRRLADRRGTRPLGIHEVEGWDRPVVAGDADGQEIARNSSVLGAGG